MEDGGKAKINFEAEEIRVGMETRTRFGTEMVWEFSLANMRPSNMRGFFATSAADSISPGAGRLSFRFFCERPEPNEMAVLEAMASGIPVLLSDIPVLREVTNDQAMFFNINDPSDLEQKLKAIADHEVDLDAIAAVNFKRAAAIAKKSNYLQSLKNLYFSIKVQKARPAYIQAGKTVTPSIQPGFSLGSGQ